MNHRRGPMGSGELNGSENYVWSTSNILGRGATAIVYVGVHKLTGEKAAVKYFTAPGGLQKQQMNELELLQRLDHENVVKLLSIETEVQGNTKVAVMELCEGQSLFNILDDPENAYGLNEKEFLLVLQHLAAGLKYLRDNEISHRDLKPGNIVKYITEDGRHIYKLTDFGAAREIADDEYFYSLCGTEEYLYPDIYDKAVMKCSEKKAFTPIVDLWSMGCTIYHVATGSLPFKPYKGRMNKQGMQFIHMNKPSGVISATQHESGQVEWSKDLPKACLLSGGLRALVTTLLQGLLEKEKTWGFKDFFTEVDKILQRIQVHIFDVQSCTEHTLYLQPDATFQNLQQQVKDKTQVAIEHQILIQKGICLDHLKPNSIAGSVLDATSQTDPIILLSSMQTTFLVAPEKIGYPQVNFPPFEMETGSVDHDALKAKNFTGAAYMIARNVERLARCHNLLLDAPSAVVSMIGKKIDNLYQLVQQIVSRLATLDNDLKALLRFASAVSNFAPLLKLPNNNDVERLSRIAQDRKQDIYEIRTLLGSVQDKTFVLQTKYGNGQRSDNRWSQGLQQCQRFSGRKETADTYVKNIRACWKEIDNYKNLKPLSHNQQQFLQLEKHKMIRTKEKLQTLFVKCSQTLQHDVKELDAWYNESQAVLLQCDCLTGELNVGISQLKKFDSLLQESQEECDRIVSNIVTASKGSEREQPASHIVNGFLHETKPRKMPTGMLQELQDLKLSQNELRLLIVDNQSVIDELQLCTSRLGQNCSEDSTSVSNSDKAQSK